MAALQNKQKPHKKKLPFVTEYCPSMPDLKHTYEQMASYTKPASPYYEKYSKTLPSLQIEKRRL